MSMKRTVLAVLLLVAGAAAQWVPIGPWGGNVQGIAVDPRNPVTLYVGTHEAVARPLSFRSDDGGATWHSAGRVEVHGIHRVVVDPHRDGTVYACTRDGDLCRTTDGGTTWSPVVMPGRARQFAPDPFEPGRVLAAGFVETPGRQPAFFESTDHGSTWTPSLVDSGPGLAACCAVAPSVPGVVYAGCDSGRVFRSGDGGATWLPRHAGLPRADEVRALAVDPFDADLVLAATDTGIVRTTDGGASWQPVAGPTLVGHVAFAPGDGAVAYAWGRADTVDRIYVSIDSGATWTARELLPRLTATSVITVDPSDPQTAWLNVLAGVLKTTDSGVTWQAANRGMAFADAYAVGVGPADGQVVYVGVDNCRVFRSGDAGVSWTQVNGFWCIENGMCCALAVAPRPPGHVVYGLEGAG